MSDATTPNTIASARAALAAGEVAAEALVALHLGRIARHDPALGAFLASGATTVLPVRGVYVAMGVATVLVVLATARPLLRVGAALAETR